MALALVRHEVLDQDLIFRCEASSAVWPPPPHSRAESLDAFTLPVSARCCCCAVTPSPGHSPGARVAPRALAQRLRTVPRRPPDRV